MAYLVEQLNHTDILKNIQKSFLEITPGMVIVIDDGEKVETYNILFFLFTPYLAKIFTENLPNSEQICVSIPAAGAVVRSLLRIISHGESLSSDQVDMQEIAEAGNILGIDVKLQFGLINRAGKVKISKIRSQKSEKQT
jgi:hypothetical protein